MNLERKEGWGTLIYSTTKHEFKIIENDPKDALPYVENKPIVLNIDLTFKCNMNCKHCVSKDMQERINKDLLVTEKLINWINESPFMVLVITGGEPFLPEKESDLISLLSNVKNKGLIIDTNGTIVPNKRVIDMILKKNVLVRVSLDSVNPNDEISLRKVKSNDKKSLEAYYTKFDNLKFFQSKNIKIAVQSVLSKKNVRSIINMPEALVKNSIRYWHIQRFILSHKATDEKQYALKDDDYQKIMKLLSEKSDKLNINLIGKMDKRHNSVYLLVGDGDLYTQGDKPRQKIHLGNIDSDIRYFDYVSSADHSVRYYGNLCNENFMNE